MAVKQIVLVGLCGLGVLLTVGVTLSGALAYLFGGSRAAFSDPVIIWYAPMFLTPAALIGVALITVASLVSKRRRRLLGLSVLAVVVFLAATAAAFNLTGLSTGAIELEGTLWGTVAVVLSVAYALSLLLPAFTGAMVIRDLLRAPSDQAATD